MKTHPARDLRVGRDRRRQRVAPVLAAHHAPGAGPLWRRSAILEVTWIYNEFFWATVLIQQRRQVPDHQCAEQPPRPVLHRHQPGGGRVGDGGAAGADRVLRAAEAVRLRADAGIDQGLTQAPARIVRTTCRSSSRTTRSARRPASSAPTSSRPQHRGRRGAGGVDHVEQRQACGAHGEADRRVHGERGAGDRAGAVPVGQPCDAVAHLDRHRAEPVVAVRSARGGHRVGDEDGSGRARPRTPVRSTAGCRCTPSAISSTSTRGVEQGADGAGVAVVERAHRVEEVRADAGAGVEGGPRLVVRRVGVADRGDDAGVGELPHGLDPAGQLGREGDHADGAVPRGEQGVDRGRVRVR